MPFLHPVVSVQVNGVSRRTLSGSTSAGFRSSFSTASIVFAADEDAAVPGDRVEISLGYYERGTRTVFVGEVDDDNLDYWPQGRSVTCSGFLARTNRGLGKGLEDGEVDEETGEPLNSFEESEASDGVIVHELLNLYGVPAGDIQSDDPPQTFGTIAPVVLRKDEPAWTLIADLDRLTFMRTFDGPDGLVRRWQVNGIPSSAAFVITEAVDLLGGSRARTRRSITNRVTMRGIDNEELPFIPYAERYADSPYIPDPPKYVSEEWQSNLAETEEMCDLYAARRVAQLNRLSEAVSVRLERCRPEILPAMSLGINAPHFEYGTNYLFWVEQVEHTWSEAGAYTSLGLIAATDTAGINPNERPVAIIHWKLERETLGDGSEVFIVFADGKDSYDPGYAAEDPTKGIAAYLWNGVPVGPAGPAALPVATFVYTSEPTNAQITLTVYDQDGRTGTATKTITASDVAAAMVRTLWAAVTSDLLLTIDGGKVWAPIGVPAVGCCEVAHPEYQLAWTAGGDLWKITLADGGAYSAEPVLTGASITAASINLGLDGLGTRRCWAAGSGGNVYFSSRDGASGSWNQTGTIPGGAAAPAIEESPFANGQLAAIAGRSLYRSFDQGGSWIDTLHHNDTGLHATRLASGHFGDENSSTDYAFVTFAGTGTDPQSRILEEGDDAQAGWPDTAAPVQPSGLTIAADHPGLYAVDTGGLGVGRSWYLPDISSAGNFEPGAYLTSLGAPRHIIRDPAFGGIVYGAADSAIFKTYDHFATINSLHDLASPMVGRMVGYGKLIKPKRPEGDLVASAYEISNINISGRGENVIIMLSGTQWTKLCDHPIPDSEASALSQGMGWCNYGTCTLEESIGNPQLSFHRPLLRHTDGTIYTWAFAAYSELLLGVTPGYHNLYKSADNGRTWEPLTNISGVLGMDIGIDGSLWVVNNDGDNVSRSTDNGASWTQLAERPSKTNIRVPHHGIWPFCDKWTNLSCWTSNELGCSVLSANDGMARTGNAKNFNFTFLHNYSIQSGRWGICHCPTGTATLVCTRTVEGNSTFRIPDMVAVSPEQQNDGANAQYLVLGTDLSPADGGGNDHPNAYRRIGNRLYFLGMNIYELNGFNGGAFGVLLSSADDGRSWSPVFTPEDYDSINAGLERAGYIAARDVAYDEENDVLYAGLAPSGATGITQHVPFVKKTGSSGEAVDLCTGMAADLGKYYFCHIRGLVAGIPRAEEAPPP